MPAFFLSCTQPPIQCIPAAFSLGVKWPGHEADHSPPSNAKVKNDGAIPPFPHMSSWHSAQLIKHRGLFRKYKNIQWLVIDAQTCRYFIISF
jgi:hypothetical protein